MTEKKSITVITTHINADFDALASTLAAHKLYPDSHVVFPGSHEKNLKNFFIQTMMYLFNMTEISKVDLSNIEKLVLVDTKNPERIGDFASILKKPDLQIHIYDHHPNTLTDVKGDYEVVEPTGACVTILTEIIRKKNIDISPDEATIMCIGIYEDTGSFTFKSTTEKDFIAAAFLLSKGANLDVVANLIAREINTEQVGLLNDMIQAMVSHNINGVEITITSVITDNYVADFAFLVHKMVKMENLNAIFAIACMGKKIYVVARSKINEVNAGVILSDLGGGGHSYAASATIKDKTPVQVEQWLMEVLYKHIKYKKLAKYLMSSPAITIKQNVSCKQAANLLTRYNINVLLVTNANGELVGYISRQVLEKALYHQLNDASVKEYMATEFAFVEPEAYLPEIQEKIIDNKQRILPVVKNGDIAGVITRTDLLDVLGQRNDPLKKQVNARTRKVINLMKERIERSRFDILQNIGKTAQETGCHAYVVGGFVRDLLMYKPNEDIDIVIEGNGIQFAKTYAKKLNARVYYHEKFGTAVIICEDGFKIDVASARMEYYKFPAALPTVEMSSIKLDLFRRDFTINTLVIHLNPDKFGTLIDFFAAQKDIKEKAIRVLHNLSFVEDPTRAFRAIRFEQRFNFVIGKCTSGLIKNAVKMNFFDRLKGVRIFAELRQILEEENPVLAILRLRDYDLLKIIHPALKLNDKIIALLNSVKKVLSWHDLLFLEESYTKWAVYLLPLVNQCNKNISNEICLRLEMPFNHKTIFCVECSKAEKCLLKLEQDLSVSNGELYQQLAGFRIELILYMMALTKQEKVKKAISNYFTNLRYIKLAITGKDLIKLGFKPGPEYKKILNATLKAKLNGLLKTKDDELLFASNYK